MGGGEIVMNGETPRLYISALGGSKARTRESGWRNTEFTAYARVEGTGLLEMRN